MTNGGFLNVTFLLHQGLYRARIRVDYTTSQCGNISEIGADKDVHLKPGDVISYIEMCQGEGQSLQRGMNFHTLGSISVILMSLRPNAPYADRLEDNGKTLIYEGHDIAMTSGVNNPKSVDQPMHNPSGSLTQNGRFYEAVERHKSSKSPPELVRVYEKIHSGIWVFNGTFYLLDAWQEASDNRKVFKFKLTLSDKHDVVPQKYDMLEQNRVIPSWVKLEVWKRDRGQCVICGRRDNLHFDHDVPFSKGGSSLTPENVRVLCVRHNLSKGDKIQ
jgi:hypothetical protein